MAHIMERYFTNTRDVDLTDRLCESLLHTIIKSGATVMRAPCDYEARANLMWASTLAHNDLLSCGRTGDWSSHRMGHQLSAFYGAAHGASLSVMFPAWMKYVYKHDIPRFCQFASRVFDIEADVFNPEQMALEGISALEKFFLSIGMPITLSKLGIPGDRYREMAAKAGDLGNFVPLNLNDIEKIYKLAE